MPSIALAGFPPSVTPVTPTSSTTAALSGCLHFPSPLVSHFSLPSQSASVVHVPDFAVVPLQSPARSLSLVMQQPDALKGFLMKVSKHSTVSPSFWHQLFLNSLHWPFKQAS